MIRETTFKKYGPNAETTSATNRTPHDKNIKISKIPGGFVGDGKFLRHG